MITSMSSSGGSTVLAETPWHCKLEFNTDKMDDVDKVLTNEMQVEQNSLSFSRVSEDLQGSHSVCLATPVETR